MSQPQPSLWWAYDSEQASFSALPATPLIVPGAVIVSIILLLRRLLHPPRTREQIFGAITRTDYYKKCYLRYRELITKSIDDGDLAIHEWAEYYDLEFYLNNPYR